MGSAGSNPRQGLRVQAGELPANCPFIVSKVFVILRLHARNIHTIIELANAESLIICIKANVEVTANAQHRDGEVRVRHIHHAKDLATVGRRRCRVERRVRQEKAYFMVSVLDKAGIVKVPLIY